MRQFEKTHATTILAAVALAEYRFVSQAGGYAVGTAGAGGPTDSIGVSEHDAEAGDALSVVTAYSYLVEAGQAITAGAYVKPGANGVAMVGTIADNCGQAVEAASTAGELIEVRILKHVHPTS
jgi:hypothetical protein